MDEAFLSRGLSISLKSEKDIQYTLTRLKEFGKKNKLIAEMNGEIAALEYVLERRPDLF